MPPAAAAKFSSSVTLFGHALSSAACIGITAAFAAAFLALAVTGLGGRGHTRQLRLAGGD